MKHIHTTLNTFTEKLHLYQHGEGIGQQYAIYASPCGGICVFQMVAYYYCGTPLNDHPEGDHPFL